MNSVSQEILEAVRRAYEDGASSSAIAEIVGISRTHAYRAIQALGLSLERDVSRSIRAVVPLHNDGLTLAEISRKSGLSKAQVRRALIRSGIGSDKWVQPAFELKPWPIASLRSAWISEFKGFFYADGCASFQKSPVGSGYRPALYINQRIDNADVVSDIQSKLGGNVYTVPKKKYDRRGLNVQNQARWYVISYSGCKAVIEATELHLSELPARKCNEVKILYRAILARCNMPWVLTPENLDMLKDFKSQLHEAKRFSC